MQRMVPLGNCVWQEQQAWIKAPMKFRLHGFAHASRANGPGLRAVAWFQGCTLGCPGCFNPRRPPLAGRGGIEGITLSGGEPLQQPEALLDLLRRLEHAELSKLLSSGFSRPEILGMPLGREILSRIDVLIAGRYDARRRLGRGLLGSTNQQIHLLTSRYTMADFRGLPQREAILHPDGRVTFSGIDPWTMRGPGSAGFFS